MNGCLSADLVRMARCVLEKVDREIETGTSGLHAALMASQLYEALKIELRTTPRHEQAKAEVLGAAIDRCCRAVRPPISRESVALGLAGVLALLETAPIARPNAAGKAARPVFVVIEGGLSRAV